MRRIFPLSLSLFLFCAPWAMGQTFLEPVFSTLHLETRAEFDYCRATEAATDSYGFRGRYFNLRVGGDLNEHFSYYFHQRIIATPGAVSMFDNTDFLYLNYKATDHWSFRLGKDALLVGSYEYDALPIDVYFNTYYWNEISCFQLAASATYTFAEGRQRLAFQVANSPYVFTLVSQPATYESEYKKSLLSYNLFWKGDFGHFHTLYSVNMFERQRGYFMNVIGLGHKLIYDDWDIYLDFLHHSLGIDDWGKNFCFVSCANYKVLPWLNLFAKGGYETNHSPYEHPYAVYAATGLVNDVLSRPETDTYFYGLGVEIVPNICKDVRLHGFFCQRHESHPDLNNPSATLQNNELTVNVGVTWFMDVRRLISQRHHKETSSQQ